MTNTIRCCFGETLIAIQIDTAQYFKNLKTNNRFVIPTKEGTTNRDCLPAIHKIIKEKNILKIGQSLKGTTVPSFVGMTAS